MVQKIEWTFQARNDLRKIHDYIAADSLRYAQTQIETIQSSVVRLLSFPAIGRIVPEFPHLKYRELIVNDYRVIYRYDEDADHISIMAVVHGRRLLKGLPVGE